MPVKIGADPEFLVVDGSNNVLDASGLSYNSTEHGEIGTDHGGRVGELRPRPGTASEVTSHIKALFQHIKRSSPNAKIMAGGGVGTGCSIGGHIHIGGVPLRQHYDSFTRQRNRGMRQLNLDTVNPDHKLIYAFDFFIGRRMKKVIGGKRGSSCYGALSDIETKSHGGFEYRTPPSWLSDPYLTEATLALSERIVDMWQIKPAAFDQFIAAGKRAARKRDYNILIPQSPAAAQRYYQNQVANFKRVIFSRTYKMNNPNVVEMWTVPQTQPIMVFDGRSGTERIQLQVCQIKLIKGNAEFNQETVAKVCRFGLPEVKIYALTQDHTPWHLRLTRDIRLRPNTIYFSKSLRRYLKVRRGKNVRTRFVELYQRNSGSTEPLANAIFFNASCGDLVPQIVELIETGARTKLRRE